MRNSNKLIFNCILFLFISNSCIAGKPKHFTLLHENKNTDIEDFIKIDGFYFIENSDPFNNHSSDSHVIFYDNGIACFPPFYPTMDVYNNKFKKTTVAKRMWGTYTFDKKNKLIHTETIARFGVNTGTWVTKRTFKILDSTHILLVRDQMDNKKEEEINVIYEFKEEPNILDFSTNWLLKKGWFWKKGAEK